MEIASKFKPVIYQHSCRLLRRSRWTNSSNQHHFTCTGTRMLMSDQPFNKKFLPQVFTKTRNISSTIPKHVFDTNPTGDTIISSPYKDVHIPDQSFGEFIFSYLDEHKKRTYIVSME